MKLTLHFKRAKREGLEQPHFSLTTTAAAVMCSPSHSQDCDSSSKLEKPRQVEGHETPQTLEPTSPKFHPDPDQENPPSQALDQQEEEEAEEEQGPDLENSGMVQSAFPAVPPSIDIMGPQVLSGSDFPLTSPTHHHKRPNKRKKGKGNFKKQKAIEKKLEMLLENLNPVPFIPSKILDFPRHEKLLKRLGLWDFVYIILDPDNIRVDLIAQLIATYDPKCRCSYVNGYRIAVNRADLARAFKLPVKKEKSGNVAVDTVDLDSEALPEESITFVEDFVSNWVLLHEDMWMMPNEMLNWTRAIRDGHPEKVDWAGLFWFMVEKELLKGEQLVDCYYASHLQYLIKSQREELLAREPDGVVLREEPEKVDLDDDVKEQDVGNVDNEKVGSVGEVPVDENEMLQWPNVELTLGQDIEEKEEMKDAEMMDVGACGDNNEGPEQEQGQWVLDGNNNVGDHLLRRCNMEVSGGLSNFEDRNEEHDAMDGEGGGEEGEEEAEDGFDVLPNDKSLEGDGLTGNFLQALEATQVAFGSQDELHAQPSVDLLSSRNDLQPMAAVDTDNGKREISHEHDFSQHTLNGSHKRLRVDGPWDKKPLDFGICIEQMHQLMDRARMMYEEKDQLYNHANSNQHLFLDEIQKRDSIMEHLQKEVDKRDSEIYRLQRELYVMGNLVEDYRKALKQTDKAFAEYRQRCQLPEEPIYKDVGPGGLVLTTAEIEKRRLQQEEEYRMNCAILEQKAKEAEDGYIVQFEDYMDKLLWLNKKLTGLENNLKVLKHAYPKPKVSETEEKILQVSEHPPSE